MYFFTLREDDVLRILESIVLSKICRSQKEEEIRRWTELLHKQQLRYLYYSLDVITVTKSSMIKFGGGGACCKYVEEERGIQTFGGET
jgi:hypothetical protein